MSFTKFVTFQMAYRCGIGKLRNFVLFVVASMINYVVLTYWPPVTYTVRSLTAFFLQDLYDGTFFVLGLSGYIEYFAPFATGEAYRAFNSVFEPFYPHMVGLVITAQRDFDFVAVFAVTSLPSVFRLFVSLLFLGTFLLRPLIMRPVSLLWARIIESEKPVFTLMFGGAAAFATAISEAAKHLPG